MNPQIRLLSRHDAAVLDRVADQVFDEAVNPALLREFLADPRHHLAVAVADDRVIGFASGVHYVHPDKPAQLWINEVGVAPAFHRRGIGRQLLVTLLEHARSLGCTEAWVLTEDDNEPARGLYRAMGGVESEAVMYTIPLTRPSEA